MNVFERQVRASVVASLRDTGQAPTVTTLAASLSTSESAVSSALRALAAEHRLVLIPDSDDIWMAHPFSAVPTDFVVRIGDRRWFANCVWDGLSILALLGAGTLATHSPATGEGIVLEVADGRVTGQAIVHFLVSARHFWDDIGFTWANITAFRSEGELDEWLGAHRYVLGATVEPQALYELGADWYRTRLDVDWQPATLAEATETFARHGLVGEFWSLVWREALTSASSRCRASHATLRSELCRGAAQLMRTTLAQVHDSWSGLRAISGFWKKHIV
jgi:hypothetical protein